MISPLAVAVVKSYQDARPLSAGRVSSTIISCGFARVSTRGAEGCGRGRMHRFARGLAFAVHGSRSAVAEGRPQARDPGATSESGAWM